MKKGKSNYNFQLNCDPNAVNSLIQSYLHANGYSLYEKKGEQYYRAGDAMLGYTGFTYMFQGQTLIINAWLDGALGQFPVEQNNMNMLAMNYRNSLGQLFQQIGNLNNGGVNMNNQYQNNVNNNQVNYDAQTGQPIQNNYQQPMQQQTINNPNQFAQTFQNETTKKQEKMCEIGFWISLFGLLCSFMGLAYGVIIYILNFYFASQGLKTRKKGKAIATIVLSIVSILIIILQLMMS